MRIGVMQPYLFPYFPYFQLIHAVDHFVLLDNVQFTRSGWMRRNRVRLGDTDHLVSFPVKKSSLTTLVNQARFPATADAEARRVRALLSQAYRRSAHRGQIEKLVFPLLEKMTPGGLFIDFAQESIEVVCRAIGIDTPISRATGVSPRETEDAQGYVIKLCRSLSGSTYVNAPGGRELYSAAGFAAAGLELRFLEAGVSPYPQTGEGFVPNLSIIDMIANVRCERIASMLDDCRIVP